MAVDLGTSRQITTVLRQSKVADVVQLLQQMRSQQVETNVFHCSAGIHACEKAKAWETALVLVEQMLDGRISADTVVCNAAMSTLEKGSQWHLALEMMMWMMRMMLEADTISYNSLLSGLATSVHWKKALQVVQGMKQKSVVPSSITSNSLIDACRGTEEPLWRLAVLLMALEKSRTLVTYNSSISACGLSQSWYPDVRTSMQFQSQVAVSWPVAVFVLKSMSCVPSVQPDVISYNASISVCEKNCEWQLPLHFLDGLKQKADMMSFSGAICACEQVGDWELAYELLWMLPSRRVGRGNRFCRNSAIASLHPLAWPKGLSLAGEHLKEDVITCNAVLQTLPWIITLDILASMNQAQLQPTLRGLSTALSLAWPLALQLVAGFGKEVDAIGYNGLLNAHKSSGWRRACKLLMLRRPTVLSYSCAVSACEVADAPFGADVSVGPGRDGWAP